MTAIIVVLAFVIAVGLLGAALTTLLLNFYRDRK